MIYTMKYIQCSQCYKLDIKDARSLCRNCGGRINVPRPDNYYKGSYIYPEIELTRAVRIKQGDPRPAWNQRVGY